jgi:hypothetical protein
MIDHRSSPTLSSPKRASLEHQARSCIDLALGPVISGHPCASTLEAFKAARESICSVRAEARREEYNDQHRNRAQSLACPELVGATSGDLLSRLAR